MEARQSHDAALEAVAVGSSCVDVTAFMGGPTHGTLSLDRRRAHGQRRALREMPRRSQLRRLGGHQRHWRGSSRHEFIQAHHRMDDVRQLKHLHLRHRDRSGNVAVGNRIARAEGGSVMVAVVVGIIAFRAASLDRASTCPIAAHRSRDHQGQQQKCEDLPEAFHCGRG